MRVGRLGVVDPPHATPLGDHLHAVGADPRRRQRRRQPAGCDARTDRRGGRRGGVGDVVGSPHAERVDRDQRRGLLGRDALDQHAVEHAHGAARGRAQAEREPARRGRVLRHQPHAARVLGVAHGPVAGEQPARGGCALVAPDARLGGGVRRRVAVPVEVVVGHVEHHADVRAQGVAEVQLEAGQLDHGQRRRRGDQRRQRAPDVAGGGCVDAGGQQLGGGGLAVGPGDRQQPRAPVEQAPGQLGLAPDGDARTLRGRQDRRPRRQPGAGDHDVGRPSRDLVQRVAHGDRAGLDQPAGALRDGVGGVVVQQHVRTRVERRARRRQAGPAESGDQDAVAGQRTHPMPPPARKSL